MIALLAGCTAEVKGKNGRLVDATGVPVSDQEITFVDETGKELSTIKTDDEGYFDSPGTLIDPAIIKGHSLWRQYPAFNGADLQIYAPTSKLNLQVIDDKGKLIEEDFVFYTKTGGGRHEFKGELVLDEIPAALATENDIDLTYDQNKWLEVRREKEISDGEVKMRMILRPKGPSSGPGRRS
jgi:hypothetical protein